MIPMRLTIISPGAMFCQNLILLCLYSALSVAGINSPPLLQPKKGGTLVWDGQHSPVSQIARPEAARTLNRAISGAEFGTEQMCQCIPRSRQCSIVPDTESVDVDDFNTSSEDESYDMNVPRKKHRNRGRRLLPSRGRYPQKPRNRTRIVNKPIAIAEEDCEVDEMLCCDSIPDFEEMPTVDPLPPGSFPESPRACGVQRIIPVPSQPILPYGQAEFGEYPWHAIILNSSNSFVGAGALIDRYHIVTAAHKVTEFGRGKKLKVRLGEWNTRDQNEPYPFLEAEIENIFMHPNFNVASLQNLHDDVAIIKLLRPVVMDSSRPHIRTVCLPRQAETFVGKRCWVAGFGKSDFTATTYSPYLKEVDVTVMDSNTCESRLRRTRLGPYYILNRKSFICAGGEAGKDACTGDGGASLVCKGRDNRFHLAGLVAFGIGCGDAGVPGVYVNIPSYSAWIQSKINGI